MRVKEIKLLPTEKQREALLATIRTVNASKNFVVEKAPVLNARAAHKLCYRDVRDRFGLSAQLAVLAIGDAAASRRHRGRVFRCLGSIAYDTRIAAIKKNGLSLSTLDGRETLAIAEGCWRPEHIEKQSRLVYRDGMFFFCVPVVTDEPTPDAVEDFVGVDLGIVNIAHDSDGNQFNGSTVDNVRHRYRRRRAALQKKGTKSSKRRLRRIRRKESRFARNVNHCISKSIVAKAKGTFRGIALEDLKGIRERTTVRRSQRARMLSWSFGQLRTFIEYKAKEVGVSVVAVDPRNTSRTCPLCGNIDKANRRTRDWFCCVSCAFAGPADHIAAENIRRAAVNRPIVSSNERETVQAESSFSSGTSLSTCGEVV